MPRGPVRALRVGGNGRNPVARFTLILAVLGAVGVGTFFWMRRGDVPVSGRVVSAMGVSNSPAPTPSSNAVRTTVEPQRPVVALPPVATNRLVATNRIVTQVPPPSPGGAATGSPQGAQGIAGTNVPGIVPASDTGLDDLSTVPDRAPTNILEAQIVLAGLGISSGSVDGVGGYQTGEALRAFQNSRGLEETGRLDNDTQELLRIVRPLFRRLVLKPSDFEGLAPVPDTWLGKSKATNLGFETVLESLAERSHSSPILLRKLNPGVEWSTLKPGQEVVVPNAVYPPARRAALARIIRDRSSARPSLTSIAACTSNSAAIASASSHRGRTARCLPSRLPPQGPVTTSRSPARAVWRRQAAPGATLPTAVTLTTSGPSDRKSTRLNSSHRT